MFYNMNIQPVQAVEKIPQHWDNILAVFSSSSDNLIPQEFGVKYFPDLQRIRFCKLEVEYSHIIGTICIPGHSIKSRCCFSFAIWKNNLLFIDNTGTVNAFLKKAQKNSTRPITSTGLFFCELLGELLHSHGLPQIERLENKASHMEEDVLKGKTENFNQHMIAFRKELSRYSRFYAQIADLCMELQANTDKFFSPPEIQNLKIHFNSATRLHNEALSLREYAMQIREVFQAQIDLHQNKIMKILTIVTTVFLPLTLITGWYGMNFEHMPELSWAASYPTVAIICFAIFIFCLWLFKKKKFW